MLAAVSEIEPDDVYLEASECWALRVQTATLQIRGMRVLLLFKSATRMLPLQRIVVV